MVLIRMRFIRNGYVESCSTNYINPNQSKWYNLQKLKKSITVSIPTGDEPYKDMYTADALFRI